VAYQAFAQTSAIKSRVGRTHMVVMHVWCQSVPMHMTVNVEHIRLTCTTL
jgi:hypothetical protein